MISLIDNFVAGTKFYITKITFMINIFLTIVKSLVLI